MTSHRILQLNVTVIETNSHTYPSVLQITPLERDALQLLAHGKTLNELSSALRLSAHEITLLLARLCTTLGTTTQQQAVALARKRGLLTPEPASR